MGTILSIIGFFANIGGKVLAWWHDKGVRDAQRVKDYGENAVAGQREIDTAQQARDAVSARVNSDPGSVRDGTDPDARPYNPGEIG